MSKVYFYYGSMSCGKTTQLIQTAYDYKQKGMNAVIFKPVTDTRDGDACHVKSRITDPFPAYPFDPVKTTNNEIIRILDAEKPKAILIDEVQFFGPRIKFMMKECDRRNIALLCYGLRNSFTGESFPASIHLLTHADVIDELKNMCFCGRKATHNLLVQDGKPVRGISDGILVGDVAGVNEDDGYHAVCRTHFYKGKWKFGPKKPKQQTTE